MRTKRRVFVSYHHRLDQEYRRRLQTLNRIHGLFDDYSVDTGSIDERLPAQSIRRKIRDDYLRDSTVTLLLVGEETQRRKHIDWEIYSSMINGSVNEKSGILVVMLPTTGCWSFQAGHGDEEKELVYPDEQSWAHVTSKAGYRERYPYAPERIIDNLYAPGAFISVTLWDRIYSDPEKLRFLIDVTHRDRKDCKYDLSLPMRKANS